MISIVTPVYNEEKTLKELFERIEKSFKKTYENFEVIFVDNGSTDDSLNIIKELAITKKNVKYLSLTKNVGHQGGIWAGIKNTINTVIIIDSDLQQPPELIEQFINRWKEGYKIVKTKKINDQDKRWWKKFFSSIFYRIINFITNLNLFEGQSDFCLLDQEVVKSIKQFKEKKIFIRGLINLTGFKSCYVEYEVQERREGYSKFTKKEYFNFAVDGIFNYSKTPINIMFFLGILIAFLCLFYVIYLIIIFFQNPENLPPGWISIFMIIMFFGSLNLLSFSMIGKYILLILEDGKKRPEYFISEKNF